jgi:hypothetical protein
LRGCHLRAEELSQLIFCPDLAWFLAENGNETLVEQRFLSEHLVNKRSPQAKRALFIVVASCAEEVGANSMILELFLTIGHVVHHQRRLASTGVSLYPQHTIVAFKIASVLPLLEFTALEKPIASAFVSSFFLQFVAAGI